MAQKDVVPHVSVDEIIDIVGAVLIVLDTDGGIVSFNAACERITGYRRAEIIGQSIWDVLIPPEQHDGVKAVFRALVEGKGPNKYANDWIAKNGEHRRIAWSNTISRRPDGSVEYVIGTGTDMTDFLATEAALRNNRSLLQMIIATSPEAIVTIDEAGIVESFNSKAEEMFGYAAHEVVGQKVNMLMPEPYAAEHDSYIDRYQRTKERRIIGIGREVAARRKDGSVFPVELAVGEAEIDQRRLFTGFIRDITRRREAEEARIESDRRLAQTLDVLPLGVILCDAEGRVTHINQEMRKFMSPAGLDLRPGIDYEELVRRMVAKDVIVLDGQDKEQWLAGRLAQIRSPERTQTEFSYANGQWVMAVEQKTAAGEIMALRIDITAQKQAEEALRSSLDRQRGLQSDFHHVSRLSAMGEMAATLAHELNQPLTAVINYVQACRRLLQSDAPGAATRLPELMGKAVDQAHRAGDIIAHIRGFVARGDSERIRMDLNAVVKEASDLALVGVKGQGIAVTMKLADALPPVLMDGVQIQQVVVNLVRNSVDALQACAVRAITIATARNDAMHVSVSVSDNGPGLDPDIAKKLFDPFNTSKQEGMGIGLSVCRSIVQEHGGVIAATPNPGGGVTFTFTLPIEG